MGTAKFAKMALLTNIVATPASSCTSPCSATEL